jgi:prophage DNA circulation protein
VQDATAALCRRTALGSLANACAAYQPTSSNDAQALQAAVAPLFDAEITIAADAGQDATYLALRAMRTAVVKDLIVRGASLPALRVVTSAEPQPALTLAYRLYLDATRADDLIARADPIHPAFMPLSFSALAS